MQRRNSKTEKRRALQPLWNTFDQILKPHENGGLLLSVSGGPDSLALLEAFARWPGRDFGEVLVVSLDHGLRSEARFEASRVVSRASVLGFNAVADTFHGQGHTPGEGQLRRWRYQKLWHLAQKHHLNALVLAQHQDDEAESYLMDLLGVGGGPEGASMGREVHHEQGCILRPFLALSKNQLALALSALGLSHYAFVDRLDQQNQNWRAFIRNEILPKMLPINSRLPKRLASRAEDRKGLQNAVEDLVKQNITQVNDRCATIALNKQPPILLRLALQRALKGLAPHADLRQSGPTLAQLLASVSSNTPKTKKIFHFSGVQIRLEGQTLWVEKT